MEKEKRRKKKKKRGKKKEKNITVGKGGFPRASPALLNSGLQLLGAIKG
jgi:hypothetical protein